MRRALVLLLALGGSAVAQTPDLAAKAAKRYPQPVRVDTLIGRQVLEPIEAQPVLGHVTALTRRPDGGVDFAVRLDGLFGIGGRTIAVPAEAIGLLGEHVALLDTTPAQLAALPTASSAAPLAGTEIVRVGLVKPFH